MKMSDNKKIYLAILNIDSFVGHSINALHVYGKLILSTNPDINIDNIGEHYIENLGEKIEMLKPITLELAKKLDENDGGNWYQIAFRQSQNLDENDDIYRYSRFTERFDSIDEIVNAGIEKWQELNLNCPFISVYRGQKYKANDYDPSSSVILYPLKNEKYNRNE